MDLSLNSNDSSNLMKVRVIPPEDHTCNYVLERQLKPFYRQLDASDKTELSTLHDALFPISYSPEFFEEAVSNDSNLLGYGAFSDDGALVGFVIFQAYQACDLETEVISLVQINQHLCVDIDLIKSNRLTSHEGLMTQDAEIIYDPDRSFSVIYILTLGVHASYRCCGIGRLLIT